MNPQQLFQLHKSTCEGALALMHKKNHDYRDATDDPFANLRRSEALGVSPIKGILVRVMDKLARISTFEDKGVLLVDENTDNCVDDVINYMILLKGLLVERTEAAEGKPKPGIASLQINLAGGLSDRELAEKIPFNFLRSDYEKDLVERAKKREILHDAARRNLKRLFEISVTKPKSVPPGMAREVALIIIPDSLETPNDRDLVERARRGETIDVQDYTILLRLLETSRTKEELLLLEETKWIMKDASSNPSQETYGLVMVSTGGTLKSCKDWCQQRAKEEQKKVKLILPFGGGSIIYSPVEAPVVEELSRD